MLEAPKLTFAFNYGILSDKYAEINFKTGEQINLSFSSKELTFDKSVTLPLGKLIIPIAVTGGTVNVTISLKLVFGANGSAKFEAGFSQKLSIDAGMKATLNPANVTSFNNSNYDFTFQQPQLEGKISASAAVNPDVALKLWQYTLAGINNNLGVKTTAKANISLTNICYRVSADAYLSSIAFVMLPKASLNISFSWDGLSGGLDFSMEKYPKELFTYTKPLYDFGETCIVENIAPIANAGADKTTNADTSVFLDGIDSIDTDGTIISYEWTQTAGTKVTLTNASSATPSFTTPSTADTLSFKLTVTDNKGATATDYINVIVSGGKSNYKPTANAGFDRSVNSSVIVTLDGSASSDIDGSIVSYKWKQAGGTQVSLTNDDTSTPSFAAPSTTDTLTFKLTVTDNLGATANDYVQVSVTSAITGTIPSAPTGVSASAGDGQITISWSSVSGATSYNIYWSTTSGVTKTTGTKLTGGTSPYTHTGRTNGTTYYYVVTAVNSYGESSESSQVSGIPSNIITIADSLSYPNFLAVYQNNVYWTENVPGDYGYYSVKKVSINGGGVTVLVPPSPSGYGYGITVDDTSVYWSVTWGYGAGKIFKAPTITGGTVTTLASANQPYDIAVDSTHVYWAENNGGPYGSNAVRKIPLNGGTVTALTTTGTLHGIMAMDNTYVYYRYNYNESYRIGKVAKTGGTVVDLASNLASHPTGIAVDDTNVYWVEENSGTLKMVSINGGIVTTLASELNKPRRIAIDTNSVYWTETGSGAGAGVIKMVSKNGGTVSTLVSGLNSPFDIAIDSSNIYWTEKGTDVTVKKMTK